MVVDNHHTSKVVFSVLDLDGFIPVPTRVWDHVADVHEAVLSTIEEFSPPSWSFVFTNVLTNDKQSERARVDRLVTLAARTARRYVPVLLYCDEPVLLSRVANEDRAQRRKWLDPHGLRTYVRAHELVAIDDLAPLRIDTTHLQPDDAATIVLDHIARHS